MAQREARHTRLAKRDLRALGTTYDVGETLIEQLVERLAHLGFRAPVMPTSVMMSESEYGEIATRRSKRTRRKEQLARAMDEERSAKLVPRD